MNFEGWRTTLIATLGMVLVSGLAFYALSHIDTSKYGDLFGKLATIALAVWMVVQIWAHATQVRNARHQLLLMGVSFIQVVPFLFGAVYGAFGYEDKCVVGAESPSDVLYFSYVTFTTVGFGDLRPEGMCRALAVSEAITGYVLLGLFVAAAVAVFAREHHRDEP